MRGQCGSEAGVGHHLGMADAIDRSQGVPNPHGVNPPPSSFRLHAGVDLQMQVTMRIPRTGCVMPHRDRLNLRHRDLHLPAPGTDPRRRVLSEPADDLRRRPVLRPVIRRRNIRVQLGASDHDFGPFTTTSTKRTA
jgi:hypothetical protein